MRAIAVVGSLILVAALACLWWSSAVGDEMPAPGAPRDGESAVARAAGLAEASVQASPAANERESNIRTSFDANALPDSATETPFALIGRVVDEQSKPIENAVVTASPSTWYEVFESPDLDRNDAQKVRERVQGVLRLRRSSATDADGRFRLGVGGPSEQIELRVQARGRIALQRTAQRPAKADVDLGTLTLARGAVVAGRVVDRAGRPVVAARVSRGDENYGAWGGLESPGGDVYRELQLSDDTVSDEGGAFELPNVPPGKFSLLASHPNHPPARLDGLTVAVGAVLSDLLVVVEPGTTISGRVTGAPAGVHLHALAARTPSEWAKETNAQERQMLSSMFASDYPPSFGERTAPVSADGTFVLKGLAVGRSYRVWAVQTTRERAGPATCCGAVDVPAGGQGIELRYDSGVTINCRLVDERTGAPIEEAWVRRQLQGGAPSSEFGLFDRGGSERLTCPNGQLTFASLRPKAKQTLTLAVEAVGYAAFTRENIALPTAGMLDLGTLRLAPSPVVRVLVTIAASGQPLAGAQVRLQAPKAVRRPGVPSSPAPLTGKTDDQGRCTLNSRSGAEVRLYVTAANYAPFTSDPLTLPADENTDIHAQLVEGGVVHVTAEDADGAIAGGVSVLHRAPDGTTSTQQADATGRVTFARLAPGRHGFRISADEGFHGLGIPSAPEATSSEAGLQSIDVDDGSAQTLKLTQEPQAVLAGIVRENGLALAGARVSFARGSGQEERRAVGSPDAEAIRRERETAARSVTTDALGHYELKGLVAGAHRLQITHESRAMPASVAVSLQIGPNVANVDLTTAILRGVVRDPTGKPVAEATVRIHGSGRASSPTDAEGRYELRGVQDGTDLVVRARAAGFAEATAPTVRVDPGMTRVGVDITLAAAGRIEVRTAAEGVLRVTARREGGDAKDPRVASAQVSDGKALLKDLLPGRWRVSLLNQRAGSGSQPLAPVLVEVVAGQTAIAQF